MSYLLSCLRMLRYHRDLKAPAPYGFPLGLYLILLISFSTIFINLGINPSIFRHFTLL